jgi:hypothetical protein
MPADPYAWAWAACLPPAPLPPYPGPEDRGVPPYWFLDPPELEAATLAPLLFEPFRDAGGDTPSRVMWYALSPGLGVWLEWWAFLVRLDELEKAPPARDGLAVVLPVELRAPFEREWLALLEPRGLVVLLALTAWGM